MSFEPGCHQTTFRRFHLDIEARHQREAKSYQCSTRLSCMKSNGYHLKDADIPPRDQPASAMAPLGVRRTRSKGRTGAYKDPMVPFISRRSRVAAKYGGASSIG